MGREAPLIGVLTPPGWYDPTLDELTGLFAAPVRLQQTMVDVPDLDYDSLAAIAGALEQVKRGARLLDLAGSDVVAMTGTPFAWAELSSEDEVRTRVADIARAAGCPVVMAGTAIVDALRALGATRIGVLTPYYTRPWREATRAILTACGFDVAAIASADQLGLAGDIGSIDDHEATSGEAIVRAALRRLAEQAGAVDALVVAGAGARTLALTPDLEAELGLPIVSSDTALYRAIAACLGVPVMAGALGRMEATLSRSAARGG